MKKRKLAWCVGERRPTGPDKIFYVTPSFRTRAEAEKERNKLAARPEKAGFSLFVTARPEVRRKPTRRPSSRRTRR